MKICSWLLLFMISGMGFDSIAQNSIEGFYTGIGTGVNISSNSGLIKTYVKQDYISGVQNMGDITGYSLPILIDVGYRFNPYFSTEFTIHTVGISTILVQLVCLVLLEGFGAHKICLVFLLLDIFP